MITTKQLETLKKKSISVDPEKVKLRVPETYKSAAKSQKDELKKLAGMSHNTFYNIAKSGAATAKVVISLAQVLNVSPYYLIGEIDDKEPCDGSILKEFFKKYSNQKTISTKAKFTKTKKANTSSKTTKPVNTPPSKIKEAVKTAQTTKPVHASKEKTKFIEPVKTAFATFSVDLDNSKKMTKAVNELSEESAVVLMKALMFRAKAGGNAEILCDVVKRCLLS